MEQRTERRGGGGGGLFIKPWEERPHSGWFVNHSGSNGTIPGAGGEEVKRKRAKVCFGAMSISKDVIDVRSIQNVGVKDEITPQRVRFAQLVSHPAAFMHFVPNDLALFFAGAFAGAAAKSLTAPLDRIKLLMQVQGLKAAEQGTKKSISLIETVTKIGQEEGLKGYWKGNLPQVIRVIPYSAVQLFAYEVYKKLFKGADGELSVLGRLAAGGCAGMTSTLVTYPLDVLRLRLAVDPASRTMTQVALQMLRDEGVGSFYKGLGPSLIGIAPYIAINFCVFDLIKKSLPEDWRKSPQGSFVTAIASATFATVLCYPLDTVRRQMQMKGSPFNTILDAFPGIIKRDGVAGLYRGFVPNALKSLPNSSIRLTTFDAAKRLIQSGETEYQKLVNKEEQV